MTTLTCADARALVSDYIDGELASQTASYLEGHLDTCPNCPPLYTSLVQTLAELKALGHDQGVEDLARRVVAALQAMPGGTPGSEAFR